MSGVRSVRVGAYVRVSTLLGQDPQNQIMPIQELARSRGWEVVEVYSDQGVSGARERRPALDQLLKDARKGKFKIVVIAAIDRLARDVRHLLNVIHELDSYGVALVSIRESIDLTTPMGRLILVVLGAFAGLEREILRERVKVALATRKLAAEKTGSGWRCGRPKTITPEIEARVHALRAEGLSIRQIKAALGDRIGTSSINSIVKARLDDGQPPVQKPSSNPSPHSPNFTA